MMAHTLCHRVRHGGAMTGYRDPKHIVYSPRQQRFGVWIGTIRLASTSMSENTA